MGKRKKSDSSDNVTISVQANIRGSVSNTVISGNDGPVALNGNVVTHYSGGNTNEFSGDGVTIVEGDNHTRLGNSFGRRKR